MRFPLPRLIVSLPAATLDFMHYETRDPSWGSLTRPDYRRHPYIWITLPDGRQFEGRATGWTPTLVLAQWTDPEATPEIVAGVPIHAQSDWIDACHVQRIKRSEATNRDSYDDYEWFSEQGEL